MNLIISVRDKAIYLLILRLESLKLMHKIKRLDRIIRYLLFQPLKINGIKSQPRWSASPQPCDRKSKIAD